MPALAQYLLVTFGWTWTVWWIAVFAGRASVEVPLSLLFVLGGLGPTVGSVFVIRSIDPAYRREFVRRLWDPKRISGFWWLALAAVAVVPALAGYLAAAAAGRPPIAETTVTFGAVAFNVGFGLAAGAVEEPGWRGVALDLLRIRIAPAWLRSSSGSRGRCGISRCSSWRAPINTPLGSGQRGSGCSISFCYC
jgi:hypothetical protein